MAAGSLKALAEPASPMAHQHGGHVIEHSGSPYHWVNGDGLSMRMQVFLTVRSSEGQVALVQLERPSGHWWIPAETLRPNEPIKEAAVRVSETWFGEDLGPEIADIITFQSEEEDEPWYNLFVFEVEAEPEDLKLLDDTVAIEFLAPGQSPPGPFAMGHEDVWPLVG